MTATVAEAAAASVAASATVTALQDRDLFLLHGFVPPTRLSNAIQQWASDLARQAVNRRVANWFARQIRMPWADFTPTPGIRALRGSTFLLRSSRLGRGFRARTPA